MHWFSRKKRGKIQNLQKKEQKKFITVGDFYFRKKNFFPSVEKSSRKISVDNSCSESEILLRRKNIFSAFSYFAVQRTLRAEKRPRSKGTKWIKFEDVIFVYTIWKHLEYLRWKMKTFFWWKWTQTEWNQLFWCWKWMTFFGSKLRFSLSILRWAGVEIALDEKYHREGTQQHFWQKLFKISKTLLWNQSISKTN